MKRKRGKQQVMDMANGDQLNDNSILASTTVLETLVDPLELIFVFGPLFQSLN